MKKVILVIVGILLIIFIRLGFGALGKHYSKVNQNKNIQTKNINSNESQIKTEQPEKDKKENQDLSIQINNVQEGQVISSPLDIEGQAKGNWFFEASFPVILLDKNGKEIGTGNAEAKGNWMTTEFVPFKVHLEFQSPSTETGTIVFEKDNPSGLKNNDDKPFMLKIRFK